MRKPVKSRHPKYENFDAMLSDVDTLLREGYQPHGNWTLGQSATHIANWMCYPLEGFPVPPLPLRAIFWVMKHTVAPGMKRKILAEGFKGGTPTAPESVPDRDHVTDAQGVELLRSTVQRLKTEFENKTPLKPSPLFGEMDKATLTKVTLLHAEHHFGYLEPKSGT